MEDKMIQLRDEFLAEIRGYAKSWIEKEGEASSNFEGLTRSFLQTLDSRYYLAPVDNETNKDIVISGTLEDRYLGRGSTGEKDTAVLEAQDEFLDHVRALGEYWQEIPGDYSQKYRLHGFMFSMMVAMDGNATLPSYFLEKIGPDGKPNGIDIAGELHDNYHEE